MRTPNRATGEIQISGIRKFADLVSQYKDALSLTIGQPHFPTPSHIREAAKQAIDAGYTSYTPNRGLLDLRRTCSTYYGRIADLDYCPETEILVTAGATHALDITLRALIEPGDEVIIPTPAYPGYEPLVLLAGAVPVHVDTRSTGFKLTPNLLRQNISERSKVVILSSPANPTGITYDEAELAALAAVIRDTNLYVVSDELYAELRFDGRHGSISREAGLRERTVVIQGLSKSHSMTGWRIGFTFAPEALTQEMVKVLQYSISCASSISQYAALEALLHGVEDSAPMRELYRQNSLVVKEKIEKMGLSMSQPGGAFYAFPSIMETGLSSQEFAVRMLSEVGVAVVPGDAFGSHGEGYVRLSFACESEKLAEGLSRMERFVRGL